MILLDANVLIYAFGAPHPYKQPSRQILTAVSSFEEPINIDVETLQEVLHVYVLRRQRSDGVSVVRDARLVFHSPLPITALDIDSACKLVTEHPTLETRDAIHAAVALNYEADTFVSADKAFAKVKGLTWIDPAEFAADL